MQNSSCKFTRILTRNFALHTKRNQTHIQTLCKGLEIYTDTHKYFQAPDNCTISLTFLTYMCTYLHRTYISLFAF